MVTRWDRGFFESTRGRIVTLLRRGSRTVDELARALGVTDNAVRGHLAALERDGLVRQHGARPTGGKPAYAYEIAPEAEHLFSAAYVPVLTQLVAVLAERMTSEQLAALLTEVGRRLAFGHRGSAASLRARAEVAATVLTELGGIVDVESNGAIVLRGFSCPLADAVRAHPETCQSARALVAEIVGVAVEERCDKGERPRCHFVMPAGVGGSGQ